MTASAFDVERFSQLLGTRGVSLGAPLHFCELTGSTNDDAMEAARAGAPHGATFVANAQTRGRGRRGATWSSPPGENLLFSVVLRPKLSAQLAGTLTLPVGLAVRDALRSRVDAPVLVKWPNDLMADGRKLAGILLESQLIGSELSAVVVGVGINVAMRDLPADIAAVATSVALLGGTDLDRSSLLVDVLEAIERRARTHEERGLAAVLEELRGVDALAGRRIRVESLEGVARGIDERGALKLVDDQGELHAVSSGSIELL